MRNKETGLKENLIIIFLAIVLVSSLTFGSLAQAKKKTASQSAPVKDFYQETIAKVPANLLTVAESSQFTATSLYQDVLNFISELRKISPNLVVENIGRTAEGRDIPMLILSQPPVFTPQAARQFKKTVIYIQANIHAGEVEGKEATLMLAREILLAGEHPYLNNLVILIVPNLNADGNEKISPENRRQQPGPEKGVGTRQNALNQDLNRDAIKLESPEMRAVVEKILNRWDPALVIDCHTTDGAYHQETVTYSWPVNPNSDRQLLLYQRDTMLPAIVKGLKEKYQTLAAPYGMFRDWRDPAKGWETFEPQPRYFTNYAGIRNRLSILDENYVHADYRTRVISCYYFLKSILDYCSQKTPEIQKLIEEADRQTILKGLNPQGQSFALDFELKALPNPITINTYEMEAMERLGGGFPQLKPTDRLKPVTVPYFADYVPKKTTTLPYAYLINVPDPTIKEKLLAHGLLVEKLTSEVNLEVEVFLPKEIKASDRPFQGHRLNQVQGEYKTENRKFQPGTILVKTAQPLGYLAAYLLEPESDDGLVVWNFLDKYIFGQWQRGFSELPVYRLLSAVNIPTVKLSD